MVGRRRKTDSLAYFDDGDDRTQGDEEIHVSTDGNRVFKDFRNLHDGKRRRMADLVETDARLNNWTPLADSSIEDVRALASTVSSFDAEPELELEPEPELEREIVTGKRKRYQSSVRNLLTFCCDAEIDFFFGKDDPMSLWRSEQDFFLDELLRRDGLGDYLHRPKCAFCTAIYGQAGRRIFRCKHCGDYLQCETCVMSQHALRPLHVLQVGSSPMLAFHSFSDGGGAGMEWQVLDRGESTRRPPQR